MVVVHEPDRDAPVVADRDVRALPVRLLRRLLEALQRLRVVTQVDAVVALELVVRPPSAFGMTSARPPSMTAATTELAVPRSMPTALAMSCSSRPR
jgi:hypothetical protein